MIASKWEPPESATAAYCHPEDYEGFEVRHVPTVDRLSAKYGGYSLVIFFESVGNDWEVIGNRIEDAR